MTKTTKTSKKRIRRVLLNRRDLASRTLTMAFMSGESITCAFNGLPADVLYNLAMTGAAELLSRAQNKVEAWKAIASGEAFQPRRKVYPMIVQAMAALVQQATGEPMPLEKAHEKYLALSEDDRKRLRLDPAIRAKILEFSGAQKAQQTPDWQKLILGTEEEAPAELEPAREA